MNREPATAPGAATAVGTFNADSEALRTITAAARPRPSISAGGGSDLAKLLAATAVSQIGDWCYNVALLVTVYEVSNSGLLLAATTVARIVPDFVMGPIGGIMADRHNRRAVMIASDSLRAALMALFWVAVSLQAPVIVFPALAGLSSLVGAPYRTCIAATIPQIVPDERLPTANAARSFTTEASVVVGPLLSAGLLLIGRPGVAFLLNAGTFLTAAVFLTWMTRAAFNARGPGAAATLRQELATGARALRDHPRTWPVCGADVLGSGVYGAVTVLLLYLSRDLTGSEAGYGLIFTASGLGGMAGAMLTSHAMTKVTPQRLLAVSLGATALPLAIAGAIDGTTWLVVALVAMAVFGAAGVSVEIQADTILQRAVPAEAFGRAYGFIGPACYAAQAVGAGIAPAAASLLGVTGAFMASAAILLVYTVLLGWRRAGGLRR